MKHLKRVTIPRVSVAKANVFTDIADWFRRLLDHDEK